MPKYIAIAAMTLDGKIARHKNHMSNWTSKEDKVFMHALLDKCDAIIVGNNTYKTAIKPLSKRNCIVLTKSIPHNVVSRFIGCYQKSDSLLFCNPNKANIKRLIRTLNYKTIAILGGAQTYSYCLKNNLLDELYLTIEPLVFGQGINLFAENQSLNKKFKLLPVKKLNPQGSLLLHYKKI
jgi:dihydrofolate reductase